MADPTIADLAKMIETLTTTVTSLQATVVQLQKDESASLSSSDAPHDGQHHHDWPPRFQKLDFPRYDGKTDPLIFTNRYESYFHQQRIMEEEKVWMASYNLEDGAQMWYIQVQEDEDTPSWRRFKELLNLRYGSPQRSAPLAELAECRRTGTVAEYQDRFQALLARAGPLRESQRVQLFTGGLQPPLSIDVRIQNLQSLAAAMSLARQFELRKQYAAPAPRAPTRPLLPAPPPRLALPAPPGPRAATPAPISIEGRPIKRLMQVEQEERRRKGLCYNCDEKYTHGHNRVYQRLFLLEGIEEDGEEGPTEDSEEPAAEDAPIFSYRPSPGTHNFISETAARRSGLPLQQHPRLTAMVANGERVSCIGVLHAMRH
ncbi:hypothetical protein U9M48_014517 [Paspalum notatum var. saurae]|uniref:Retrotransposon gag domain-containing protein n=1 Tax=Paspalum notatum var. saurae TaxID=547442 RepID=A0AAQ3WKT1_PASNO